MWSKCPIDSNVHGGGGSLGDNRVLDVKLHFSFLKTGLGCAGWVVLAHLYSELNDGHKGEWGGADGFIATASTIILL